MFKQVWSVGGLAVAMLLSACLVVSTANYAVPTGAPTATLTFELAPSDAARVGQQIVFLDDEITMKMPAIYGLQNGYAAGPDRTGNQFADRPELVEAGRELFVFAKTTLPGSGFDNRYCRGQVSFTPVANHTYLMRHVTNDEGCVLVIIDRATNEEPVGLKRHNADRVTLPF